MKKKTIQLVVLLVLLLAAVGTFLLLRPGDEDIAEETLSETDAVYLLGAEAQKFARTVRVENAVDAYTVENGFDSPIQPMGTVDSEHTIEGIDLEYLNQTTLRTVFSNVGGLPAKKVVAESDGDFALYGLDNPTATVKVTYEDGERTLLVGDDAPGGEGIYASVDGGVFLVDANKVSAFRESRLHYVSKTITEGNNQSTIPTKMVLTGGRFREPVTVERMPDDEIASMTGFSSYRISSPVVLGADSQRAMPQLQMVFGLTGSEAVADDSNEALARYNLDTPYMEVYAEAEEIRSFNLAISQPDDEGECYVKSSTVPFIYRVSTASLPFLEMTLFELQEKMIILPHIDTVSEVEVQTSDALYQFELRTTDDELTVRLDGELINTDYFRSFYQTMIVASYDSEIEEGAWDDDGSETPESVDPDLLETEIAETDDSGQGEAETPDGETTTGETEVLLRYTYRYADGSPPDVVLFEPGPTRKAVVSLNGGRPYYARSVYVDRVLEDLPKLARGEEVDSYL